MSIYLDKEPRRVGMYLWTRGALNFTAIYTLATLVYGPHPLGRPRGRIGVPELPKGSCVVPKYSQSGLNWRHVMYSQHYFEGCRTLNGTPKLKMIETMTGHTNIWERRPGTHERIFPDHYFEYVEWPTWYACHEAWRDAAWSLSVAWLLQSWSLLIFLSRGLIVLRSNKIRVVL